MLGEENLDYGLLLNAYELRLVCNVGTLSFFIACFSQEYNRRPATYMNVELTLAIDELRRRPTDKSWFIPTKLNACSIPDREIGNGETLRDIHHVELYEDWSRGIEQLEQVIRPASSAETDQAEREVTKEEDSVARAFSQAGLSPFSGLSKELQRLISRIDDGFAAMMQALTDVAADGPRLFSFEPVEPCLIDRPGWVSQDCRVTLWCEHSRLPLPVLNGKGDVRGVYHLTLPRDWLVKAAPLLKLLTDTLSLVAPVAASATKLKLNEVAFSDIENQLDRGQEYLSALPRGGEAVGIWKSPGDTPHLDQAEAIRAQGAIVRQLQVWVKELDSGFGGLVPVKNKRDELFWVHPQFEAEY